MSRERQFANLASSANMTVTVDKCSNKAVIAVPGFGVDCVDRTGNLSVWSLQRLFSAGRILAFHIPNEEDGRSLLEYDKLLTDRYTFIASTKTEIAKEFYQLVMEDRKPDLSIRVHLGYVGTSSLNTVAILEDKNTGIILGKNINQVVSVDVNTRRPVPLPDWWLKKYSSAGIENEPLKVLPIEVPEKVHNFKLAVRWEDINVYKHTNYISYIQYCMDAAMQGVVDNAYTDFKEDILKYHVKEMEMCYLGESLAGDILNIASWEVDSDPYCLYFDITKAQTSLFQSKLKFHVP